MTFFIYIGFYYDKIKLNLSQPTEEVATFYAEVFNENYQLTKNDLFNKNFFSDWKCVMTEEEKMKILDLKKCDFGEIGESNFTTLGDIQLQGCWNQGGRRGNYPPTFAKISPKFPSNNMLKIPSFCSPPPHVGKFQQP